MNNEPHGITGRSPLHHLAAVALAGLNALAMIQAEPSDPAVPLQSAPAIVGEELTLPSKSLDRTVTLRVSLPGSYKSTDARYPVLYTFQSFFLHVSGVADYLSRVSYAPEMIVVSVESYLSADLSPERLESNPDSGGADRFIRFFTEELFPVIEGRYRTVPYRLAYSGSFGGGFLVYCALSHPDMFNAYVAATPSIDFEGMSRLIPDRLEQFVAKAVFRNRFLFMALEDWPDLSDTLDAFTSDLRRLNPEGLTWEYHHWPEEDHGTIPHRALFQGLRGVFSRWSRIPEQRLATGLSGVEAYRREISGWFGVDLGISRGALFQATQHLMKRENYAEAARVAGLLTELYPDNALGHRLLGRIWEAAGRLDLALDSYETALEKAIETSSPHMGVCKGSLERLRERMKAEEENAKNP